MNRRLVVLSAIAAWAFSGAVLAASLEVSPLQVAVPPDGGQTTVSIDNVGSDSVLVQVKAVPWLPSRQIDGVPPAKDILVVPPIAEIAPSSRQILRLALRRPLDAAREKAYRLVVSEVPRDLRLANGVAVSLRFDIPMFATPTTAAPLTAWQLQADPEGRAQLVLSNAGTARFVAREISVVAPTGEALFQTDIARTALAGGSERWTLDRPLSGLPAVVEVRAETSEGPVVAEVRRDG